MTALRVQRHPIATISEVTFANSILEWAQLYGWHRFHVRNSGHAGKSYVQGDKGFPDLVLIKLPRVIVAELKTGKLQPRPEQREWLDLFSVIPNVEVYVWHPSDWSSICRLLGANV